MRRPEAQPAILPRDRHGATRAVAYFMLTGCVFVTVLTTVIPGYGGPTAGTVAATYVTGAVLGVLGWTCLRSPDRLPNWFWVAVPILSITGIGLLDFLTKDAGVGGQLFFLWPALYAATFLRPRLIFLVLGCVFVTDFLLVYSLRGFGQAIWDTSSVVTGISLASVIIWTLRRRVETLLSKLEAQALSDTLTGLANRRAFDEAIERALAQAKRSSTPLALITLDVDNFKRINDNHGHAAGDEALLAVARSLQAVIRESDLAARLGGDEFVALLSDCDSADAARVAWLLTEALPRHWTAESEPTTLSIGVASYPADASTTADLIAASDGALYAAKGRGRNQVVVASDG
jgi:diguanylate cyclase (GGDEF)-like protein